MREVGTTISSNSIPGYHPSSDILSRLADFEGMAEYILQRITSILINYLINSTSVETSNSVKLLQPTATILFKTLLRT